MTDEELDKLFRNATENYKPVEAPDDAWEFFLSKNKKKFSNPNALNPALHNKNKRLFIQYRQIAAAIITIAITGLIVWQLLHQKNKPVDIAYPTAANTPITNNKTYEENKITDSGYNNTITHTTASAKNINNDFFSENKQTQPSFNIAHSITKENNRLPLALHKMQDIKFTHLTPEIKPTDKAVITNPQNYTKSNKSVTYGSNEYAYNKLIATINNQKKPMDNKWQMGIVGGTNITMIKGNISGTPGLNTGVIVQRRISNSRISVESGIIYESMAYVVNNSYFNPDGQPVSSYISNISGTCTMIDVPVNIRYDMVSSRKRKAYVSTGVSPTLMVKQNYTYDYTDENGTQSVNQDVIGLGKNLYAVANVSVGFEQKWNKTSVQVAPYLKIPMGVIGYGNLSLGGLGTQVAIKRDL